MTVSYAGIPSGYQLLRRDDDHQFFVAPRVKPAGYQQVVLTPVQIGYQAGGQFYSLENVPADAPARSLSVIA